MHVRFFFEGIVCDMCDRELNRARVIRRRQENRVLTADYRPLSVPRSLTTRADPETGTAIFCCC